MNALKPVAPQCDVRKLRVNLLGRILYYIRRFFKSNTINNINTIFEGPLFRSEKKRLALTYFSDLVTCIKDCVLLGLLSQERLVKRIELRDLEHFLDAVKQKRNYVINRLARKFRIFAHYRVADC